MSDGKWFSRDLKLADRARLVALLDDARRPDAVFVRAALERLSQGEAAARDPSAMWWWGVFKNASDLEAVMAVENHSACVYSANEDAMKAFANELYGMQRRSGQSAMSAAQRHQWLGESKSMMHFWSVMKDLPNRKVVTDRECDLMTVGERPDASPSSRITLELATKGDERSVSDYTAELRLEQFQIDPRKANREAHATRVAQTIAEGRQLVGKEKDTGRPFFVAELAPLTKDSLLLDQVYVPPHYRSRGKLMGGAFWAAAALPQLAGKELYYLAPDATLSGAAKSAGWKRVTGYRLIMTHG